MAAPLRPVIVVTGANSGVGYGVAQRLLVQLSSPVPSDTLPFTPSKDPTAVAPPSPFAAPDGCTIILACRNAIKAHRARRELQAMLDKLAALPDDADQPVDAPRALSMSEGSVDEDADPALVAQAAEASVRRRKRRSAAASGAGPNQSSDSDPMEHLDDDDDEKLGETSASLYDDRDLTRDSRGNSLKLTMREAKARGKYRRRFCKGTRIEFVPLDLGSMASALSCAKEVTERYVYVTHVVLNAGTAAWTGIKWPLAIWMIAATLHTAVTWPRYKTQRSGDIGNDGYGWVWQANVGAHYILVRALLPALRASPYATPSRIIWTGSMEAFAHYYKPDDFQCKDPLVSPHPYESTKYQCELAAIGLDDVLRGHAIHSQPGTPGLATDELKQLGSTNGSTADRKEPQSFVCHPGVVASSIFAEYLNVVMAMCMKLAFYLARWTLSPHHPIEPYKGAVAATHVALAPSSRLDTTMRYGSRADFWGREYVDAGRVDGWNSTSEEPGQQLRRQARDLIGMLEKVAKAVWTEAREGSLAPFAGAVLPSGEADKSLSSKLLPLSSQRRAGDDWERVEKEL